ncbi:unnamed protein product [Coffea canephora]|uniref:Uncharacterized protein n=1 Tax=Coffea canephora TaxID=49390 RepID=A0A068UAK3_COFCA|nr:unnamed protein product [Coffea canephora]
MLAYYLALTWSFRFINKKH